MRRGGRVYAQRIAPPLDELASALAKVSPRAEILRCFVILRAVRALQLDRARRETERLIPG